jgi:hypothetical protein
MAAPTAKSYPLTVVRGLTAREVAHLEKAGLPNTRALLAATRKGTRAEHRLAEQVGMTFDRMREVVNRADLLQVPGVRPATADLLELAGVNSARELSHRNPEALARTLATYVRQHRELNFRAPGPDTIARLISDAKAIVATTTQPIDTADEAKELAASSLHDYIDRVLFSDDPAGAAFRAAVLEWRPQSEWPAVQQRMHADVEPFLSGAGSEVQREDADGFLFTGRLLKLYSEVRVPRSGHDVSIYVEID